MQNFTIEFISHIHLRGVFDVYSGHLGVQVDVGVDVDSAGDGRILPSGLRVRPFRPSGTGPVGEFEFADRAHTRRPGGPEGPQGP